MVYIPGIGYISGPQDLLQNEWVVFAVVFLISFAFTYIALINFFHKKENLTPLERLMGIRSSSNSGVRAPLVVISACVSFMVSASLVRYDFLSNYLGAGAAIGVMIFSLVMFVIASLPFYRGLESNLGFLAGPIYFFIVWFVLKFVLPDSLIYSLPYNLQEWYFFITSFSSLGYVFVFSIVFGFLLSKFIKPVRHR